MAIVRVTSKDKMKKILSNVDLGSSEFVLVSEIIHRDSLPKKATVTYAGYLIMDPSSINIYLSEGRNSRFEKSYMEHLARPECLFILNEILRRSFENKKDVFFICSQEEYDYKYLDILGDFIMTYYGIKTVSSKKFLEGKKSKLLHSENEIMEVINKRQIMLINKLKEMSIDPMKVLMKTIDPKDYKKLPKNLKKYVKMFQEEEEWES